MPNLAVFVDVQNIYYTTRDAFKRQFNYRALWHQLEQRGCIKHAIAYATEPQDGKQSGFQNALKNIGFTVKRKPYIQRSDGSAKGDWDVGITIDVMELSQQVDTVVLLSGDGDFDLLIDKVRRDFGVRVEIIGVKQLTAMSLIDAANKFYPIDDGLLL